MWKGALVVGLCLCFGIDDCPGLSDVPRFVINTDDKLERWKWSRLIWGENTLRVRGPNGGDPEEMSKLFEVPQLEAVLDPTTAHHLTRDQFDALWSKHVGMKPGEAACLGGHLKALKMASQMNATMALIMEDDASPIMCPFWPEGGLQELAAEASRLDPEWEVIRLQWHQKLEAMYSQMAAHVTSAKAFCSAPGRATPRLLKCSKPVWGAAGALWSRRGMERALERNHFNGASTKIDCHPLGCHIDPALLSPTLPHCFVAAPQMVAVRQVEEGSAIRGNNYYLKLHHHQMHLQSTFVHLHWAAQLEEVCLPGGSEREGLPQRAVHVAVK